MREFLTFGPDVLPVISGPMPRQVLHRFLARDDGQLEHHTDNRLRAVVPPEGFDAYVETWPACAPVVGELRGRPVAKQTVFLGELGRSRAIELANVARREAGLPELDSDGQEAAQK